MGGKCDLSGMVVVGVRQAGLGISEIANSCLLTHVYTHNSAKKYPCQPNGSFEGTNTLLM